MNLLLIPMWLLSDPCFPLSAPGWLKLVIEVIH